MHHISPVLLAFGIYLTSLWGLAQAIADAEDEGARKKVEAESLRKLIEKLHKECKKTEKDKQTAESELVAVQTASNVSLWSLRKPVDLMLQPINMEKGQTTIWECVDEGSSQEQTPSFGPLLPK